MVGDRDGGLIDGAGSAFASPWIYGKTLLAAFAAANGIGLLSLIALPFVIGANINSLMLDEAQAGLLGTLEFVGVVVASLALAPRIGRVDRRKVAILGALIVIGANLLCAATGSFDALLLLRPIAGLGAGLALAPGNATIANAQNPERFASHMAVLLVALMVAVLFGFAKLSQLYGHVGIYCGLAATVALLSPLLVWLPKRSVPATVGVTESPDNVRIWSPGGMAVLVAVLCFSTRDTMAWAFAETTGAAAGYTPREVGEILGLQSIVGLLGPLAAAWMGPRFGLRAPLALGIIASGAVTLAVSQSAGHPWLFAGSAMFWTGTYFFTLSYLTGLAADLDDQGRIVAATGSAVMAGLAIAPVVAGHMLAIGGSVGVGVVIVLLILATLAAAIYASFFGGRTGAAVLPATGPSEYREGRS